MTTIQRLKSTRMAPYIGLMQELTPEERHLVVMFLTEQNESETKRQVPARRPRHHPLPGFVPCGG